MAKKKISMSKAEFMREHKRLVKVLKSPSHTDDLAEAKAQLAEMDEYTKGDNMECSKCSCDPCKCAVEMADHLKHPQISQKKLQNCEAKHLHHPQIKYDWSKK